MDKPSNREKKRAVAADLRRLRNTPGWAPTTHARPSPEEQLRSLGDQGRRERAYKGASECPDCVAERKLTRDDTTLCKTHLSEALKL